MKTIGIKLADGSFYPILEEGTAKTYQLDLTTVKDGQTTVHVDLYRSESGTMEDAEYVDTLEISNLVSHPNGEVDLHLSIGLNENNQLDAKVIDEETGSNVSLVSRTLAERNEPTNFELSESDSDLSLPEDAEEVSGGGNGALAAAAVTAAAGTAAVVAANAADKSDSLDDFSFDDFTDDESSVSADDLSDPTDLDPIIPEPVENEQIEDVPFSFDAEEIASFDSEPAAVEETTPAAEEEIPVFEESVAEIPEEESLSETSVENISFDEPVSEEITEPAAADFSTETVTEENVTEDFSTETLPDFGSDDIFNTEDLASETVEDTSISAEDEFALPDFDTPELTDSSVSTENTETAGLTGYFDDPAFKDDPVFTETDLNTDNESVFDTSDLDNSFAETTDTNFAAAPAMDFSDLYDKETLNGSNSTYDEDEEEKKKTHIPMIVCIICAIICVIATLLVLFVVPSKYNLLNKHKNAPAPVEAVVEQPAPVEEPEPVVEVVDAPAAEEDKVVVAPEPEVVVPVPAPKPAEKKDIKYRIRWGDTLWDIADAYYKNPWRYPKIAKYNKIKNPDLIISGTDILIPVE